MKKEVKILGLSYSQSHQGSYVVVLSELDGIRKLPIIIKTLDAQYIALKVENMKSPRPLTHDLFHDVMSKYFIDCQEVVIYKVVEGIFYCKLIVTNGIESSEVDCMVSDAICLSLTFDCPLFVEEEVLVQAGIETSDSGYIKEEPKKKKKKNIVSLDDLKKLMQQAIENEDYEMAAELRDKISKMESNSES